MAIDPNKLKSFAGGKKGGGPPPTDADYEGEAPEVDEDAEGGDEAADEDMQENGDGRFGDLIPLLEEFAEEIAAAADELDPEALSDTETEMTPDEAQILQEGIQALDRSLLKAMKKSLADGVSMDEATELAEHLVDEDMIDSPERVAGWLFRVAEVI